MCIVKRTITTIVILGQFYFQLFHLKLKYYLTNMQKRKIIKQNK